MHNYVAIRGLIPSIREWTNFMSPQYLPFKWKDKNNKIVNGLAQLQVREVRLYELVYPKDCHNQVMGMIKPDIGGKGFAGFWGKPIRILSRLLGLKKVGNDWTASPLPLKPGMTIMCLGTKEDKIGWEVPKPTDIFKQGGKPQEFL